MATHEDPSSSYHEEPAVDQSQNPCNTMQDNVDDDEAVETFSLSELTIFGNNTSEGEDPLKEDQSFEFFSEEWVKNGSSYDSFPSENILFCGDLFLPKQPQNIEKRDQGNTKVEAKSNSIDKRNRDSKSSRNQERKRCNGVIEHYVVGKNEDMAKRVSPVASAKPRWYLYGIGLAGNPAMMDLGSIRSRQTRSRKTSLLERQGGESREKSGGWLYGKGLWSLIKELGCGSQNHANTMVKASLVCIRRV